MFNTIGQTFELMKTSWGVLMKDKELVFFPIFAGIGILVLLGIFFGIGTATGTIGRLTADQPTATAGDIVLMLVVFFIAYFITVFFNAALIGAALERLRGGDPNVRSGLSAASAHIPSIIGWAIITGTVGLALSAIRNRRNGGMGGDIAASLIGFAWELATFFVVPVLVAEGLGPFAAIKRSSSLLRQTWGNQVTANFGFMAVYLLAMIAAVVPTALLASISPVVGMVFGVVAIPAAFGAVHAMEGIFKAALYLHVVGEQPREFDLRTLQTAYRPA